MTDQAVRFSAAFAWIGSTELRGCLRCGATVLWSSARGGDAMELIHRKWHEELAGEEN